MLTNKRAPRNIVENNLLNPSAIRTPPNSFEGSEINISEEMKAIAKVMFEILFGILGSLVKSNLDPPSRTGTLTDVRGILNFASPRFGITTMAMSPRSIIISGRSEDAISELS